MTPISWLKRKSPMIKRDDLDSIWLVVFNNDHQYGPFTAKEIVELVESKALAVSAEVCRADAPGHTMPLAEALPTLIAGIMAERRGGQPRTYCSAEVLIRTAAFTDGLTGQCLDISVGGIFVESEVARLRVGEVVQLTISSPLLMQPIVEASRVVRRSDRMGYALQFVAPSALTVSTIGHFIDGAHSAVQGLSDANLLNAG